MAIGPVPNNAGGAGGLVGSGLVVAESGIGGTASGRITAVSGTAMNASTSVNDNDIGESNEHLLLHNNNNNNNNNNNLSNNNNKITSNNLNNNNSNSTNNNNNNNSLDNGMDLCDVPDHVANQKRHVSLPYRICLFL